MHFLIFERDQYLFLAMLQNKLFKQNIKKTKKKKNIYILFKQKNNNKKPTTSLIDLIESYKYL